MDICRHNEKCENEMPNWTVCLALEMAALAAMSTTEQQDAQNISLLSLSVINYTCHHEQ